MASKEHLSIIKQGIEVWNRWRKENPDIIPDLSNADLSRGSLAKVNLSRASLNRASFNKADLERADLSEADLRRANLSEANLNKAKLVGADLTRANLIRAILNEANLRKVRLCWANLSEANFSEAKLSGADLTRANLIRADLSYANLGDSTLCRATLIAADLSGADLIRANFRGADLIRAYLIRANLIDTNLTEAKLSEANLMEANLSGAIFIRANLSRAKLFKACVNSTIFADVNLGDVYGLEAVVHLGPSSVGIDTIYRSKGKIPQIFLRSSGVSSAFIEYLHSPVGKDNRIYSCFIRYSIEDQEFVERLYLDLQAKGVSIWFASENIKEEHKPHEKIFGDNGLYDKLLLVLSEVSIKSEWVKAEITRARKDEISNNERKIFPIGLVDLSTIGDCENFDTDLGKDLCLEIRRNLLDFSNWKDYDAYQNALDQLLQELHDWE